MMKKIHFVVLLAFAMQDVHAQSWNTAGNNNITTANFLGTTNSRNLVFKTNNIERGRLTAAGVWRFGPGPVFVQVDAAGKLKVGTYAFPSTDGTNGQVLKTNGAGVLTWSDESNNGGGGANLSLSNLSSTAVNQSLLPDATNSKNLGSSTLSWKDIYSNGAIYLNGLKFLWIPPGTANVAVGQSALSSNTGSANTAIGSGSLFKNVSGSSNVAIGANSLQNNTTGNNNTATGVGSLSSNITGSNNSAFGITALNNNTTGDFNSALGSGALNNNTIGIGNTGVGIGALNGNQTSNFNTAIGFNANVAADGLTNATAIGARAVVDASNKVRIGDGNITSIGGQVGWTTFSDGRYKKNIKENVPGLAFINSLRPVTYSVDVNSLNSYYSRGKKPTSSDLKGSESLRRSADVASKIIQTGFVAQEVESAANKLGYDFNGVDKPKNKDAVYGLRYDQFVVPLVKAVQELSKENDKLKSRLEKLEAKTNAKQSDITSAQTSKIATSSASLQQNIPNPFNHTTTINYTLPESHMGGTSAQIMITDKSGKVLKQMRVEGVGKGMVQVDASALASGAYNYSLYVDGKLIASKQMVLTK